MARGPRGRTGRREVLEGYLTCKTKGRLKLAGESGTPPDYEAMTAADCLPSS
jgi:hypothetical protein